MHICSRAFGNGTVITCFNDIGRLSRQRLEHRLFRMQGDRTSLIDFNTAAACQSWGHIFKFVLYYCKDINAMKVI